MVGSTFKAPSPSEVCSSLLLSLAMQLPHTPSRMHSEHTAWQCTALKAPRLRNREALPFVCIFNTRRDLCFCSRCPHPPVDEAKLVLQQTVRLDAIQSPEFYDCIFVPGGHGPVYDLATSQLLADILAKAAAAGGA